jgi:hypothetical protein
MQFVKMTLFVVAVEVFSPSFGRFQDNFRHEIRKKKLFNPDWKMSQKQLKLLGVPNLQNFPLSTR